MEKQIFPNSPKPFCPAIVQIKNSVRNKVVYLDNQATTPVDPLVLDAMQPYFSREYGNPHSTGHAYGWNAEAAVNTSRQSVATMIGADAREIIFTSGATESCNLALRGVVGAQEKNSANSRRKIITTAIEHPCVLETCEDLKKNGWEVIVAAVDSDGLIDIDELYKTVDEQTLVVSVMAANNEIGVIQPIEEIGEICRSRGAYLHTDATQAAGKIPIDVRKWNVDLMSLSGHKMYAPKGIGVLFVRWQPPVKIKPLVTGGGQEAGLRPGTIPVAQVVGMGEACRIAIDSIDRESVALRKLTEKLRLKLFEIRPDAVLFGHWKKRVPGNINIGFPGFSGEDIVSSVGDEIAISAGSACSSVKVEPSHVLLALGVGAEAAQSALRISLGRFNTESDVDKALHVLSEIITNP